MRTADKKKEFDVRRDEDEPQTDKDRRKALYAEVVRRYVGALSDPLLKEAALWMREIVPLGIYSGPVHARVTKVACAEGKNTLQDFRVEMTPTRGGEPFRIPVLEFLEQYRFLALDMA